MITKKRVNSIVYLFILFLYPLFSFQSRFCNLPIYPIRMFVLSPAPAHPLSCHYPNSGLILFNLSLSHPQFCPNLIVLLDVREKSNNENSGSLGSLKTKRPNWIISVPAHFYKREKQANELKTWIQ